MAHLGSAFLFDYLNANLLSCGVGLHVVVSQMGGSSGSLS
jgi:hypothetical protein